MAFFFGTPNNTLPIFWRAAPDWKPLLPHGDALRDPRRVLEIPGHVQPPPNVTSPLRTSEGIEQLELSRDATASLFEGFQTLQNMGIAGKLILQVGLGDTAIHNLVATIQLLAEDVHEKHPVCTALLCPNPDRVSLIEQGEFIKFEPTILLTDVSAVRAASQLVNGFDGALRITRSGQVAGGFMYQQHGNPANSFLPGRYHRAAAASMVAGGFLILFLGSGRVVIIDRGVRVLSRRFGKWHLNGVPRRLREFEAEHGLVSGLLTHSMRVAFALADAGHGALITLGDPERVISLIGKQAPEAFQLGLISATDPDQTVIVSLLRQDGATVLDESGVVRATMAILNPPPDIKADEEAGKGARHTTAAKTSAATGALTIAVSEEGTITLYSKGKHILRLMG